MTSCRKASVGLLADDLDEALGHGLVVVHGLDAGEDVDLLQLPGDGLGVVGGQLGAVRPVDLVAVVLLGVVAGGDVDARLAAVVAHGEAQLRGGAQGVEDPHVDAVGGADLGGGPGESPCCCCGSPCRWPRPALGLLALGADHVGKGLGGVADDIDVHLVQAHLHGAPQAGGAKLQGAVEPALDLLGIVGDGLQLRLLLRGQHAAGEPFFIFLHVVHRCHSSSFWNRAGARKDPMYMRIVAILCLCFK